MRIDEHTVVVVTGASSGIGRATALALGARGAHVVLAARQADALEEVAAEVREAGGVALPWPTDVTDEAAVRRLAEGAWTAFGRIDAWVNNAAVTLFGRLEETPSEAIRQVVETNLFGYVYGAQSVLPYFREQGRGVLVNVSSVVAKTGQAYTAAYSMTKAAIWGLSESLRQELVHEPGIDVCVVLPPSVDTPLFQHGANYLGRAARPLKPVHPAEESAEAIVRCIEQPKAEVWVSGVSRAFGAAHALSPDRLFARGFERQVRRKHFEDRPAEPSTGNLFEPDPQHNAVSGGWRETPVLSPSAKRAVGGAAAGAALALGIMAARRRAAAKGA